MKGKKLKKSENGFFKIKGKTESRNKPANESKGWISILMERGSRFIPESKVIGFNLSG
jgi:hypothetical protein